MPDVSPFASFLTRLALVVLTTNTLTTNNLTAGIADTLTAGNWMADTLAADILTTDTLLANILIIYALTAATLSACNLTADNMISRILFDIADAFGSASTFVVISTLTCASTFANANIIGFILVNPETMTIIYSFSSVLTWRITLLTDAALTTADVQVQNVTDSWTVRSIIANAQTFADTFAAVSTFDVDALTAGNTLTSANTLARADTLTCADTMTVFRRLIVVSSWNILTLITSFLNRF